MKRGSTIFLRVVVLLLALAVLAACVFILPVGVRSDGDLGYRWIALGMYLPAVPFFIGVFQALKLLGYIDQGKAFSELSVKALKNIKYCAAVIAGLYAVGLPYIFYVADKDDAPGVALIALIFTFGPLAMSVFAGVLQKMFHNAMAIKSENDLTV